ncbi:MAG: DUF3343 domain-containing protein [Eubacteriales bacterium]|jgi:hypothetical protein|nr:DUF3343 domain-containing protein [Eubacteriales bacterium]
MYYLISYSSITYATRIKNFFKYDGDYVAMLHTPSQISKGGCSYSIKVKPHKVKQVLEVSKKCGYKIKGVYKQIDANTYEEVEYDLS